MNVGIVASRFNQFIVDQLMEGALDALHRRGIEDKNIAITWVPGALELPVVAESMAASGKIDAVIALGAVIRGETPHFDYVAGECARGLREASQRHGIAIAFGVLTTDTIEQALARSGQTQGNKGFEAAQAALETADALKRLAEALAGLGGS